jgi:exosortase/archaeosortase family protein
LSAPGGHYSAFVHDYLNYIEWFRFGLLHSSKIILTFLGYNVFVENMYVIRMYDGLGVRIVYSCIGFGIMSFWTAFIFANSGSWVKKVKWILGGLLLIWCLNITRICLLLVAINKKWKTVFYLDHHTIFNVATYSAIFIMIYFFSRSDKDLPEENPLQSGVE